ncbi:MAG: protease complex subunit PrcB family protein [Bacteroidia bacterium]|nr:protease complex subunit PrcB family protein [Bacteroidia bacterium]
MNSLRYIFIAMIFLFAFACKSPKSAASGEGNLLEAEKIAEGGFCGIEEPSNLLITNVADWEALWAKVTANRSPVPPLPPIDFETKSVLACFIGNQNSGGHSVVIQQVAETGNALNVSLLHTKPGAGCFVTDVLTQPYYIAAVNKGKFREASFSIESAAKECK